MRAKTISLFLTGWMLCLSSFAQQVPLAGWKEYLDYNSAFQVTISSQQVFVGSRFGIFSVGRSEPIIERLSRINGLSDVGVRTLRFNPQSDKLLIAYNNSNLDVLYRNDIINIPYILRSTIQADKQINDIYFEGDRAYLSTNLGVIVIHMDRYEISSTWLIGANGAASKVNGFCSDSRFFYAATDEGLKYASRNSNLEDFRSWQIIPTTTGLPNGRFESIYKVKNKLFAQRFNRLYVKTDDSWSIIYDDLLRWINVNASADELLITEETDNRDIRRIVVIDAASGSVKKIISNNNALLRPNHAIAAGDEVYIADTENGLIISKNGTEETVSINSPYGPLDGEMNVWDNTLFVAGGSVNEAWNYTFNETGFFMLENDTWKAYNRKNLSWMDSTRDIISVVKDPVNGKIYAGSYGGGLIEFQPPSTFKIYKQGSFVEETIGDPGNYRIGGLAFDVDNNLWFSNFGAARNFGVKKADGSWKKFTVPFVIKDNMTGGILIDDYNQKWIQVPQGNGLYCFNHGNSIDNTGDDRWKWYQTGKNNGNLPGNFVNAMVKDKDGFIWLGTDKGIGIIQCPGEVFSAFGCDVFQPVVQQDNFAGLLFENEDVRAIAVDGGNRKWVGTRNGVWLLSPDGEKVLLRFTKENSPLLSNEIIRIAIHPQTGEVFFSTFNGICSYRGTATEPSVTKETVLAFPNPVPSSYSGLIGIKGLPANAIIKITETNGRLIFQTKAAGGQAVWNGKDYTGRRPATGVYFILVTDDTGIDKRVGKIIFIK